MLLEAGYNQTYNNAKYEYVPEVLVGTCHTAFNVCPPGTGYGSIPHQDLTLGLNTVAAVTGTGVQTGPQRMPTMSHYIQSSLVLRDRLAQHEGRACSSGSAGSRIDARTSMRI